MPPRSPDQTEEALVSSILEKTDKMPKTKVRKALRLPMISPNRESLVMVEMDNQEDEKIVLEHNSDIKSSLLKSINLDHVGIRELNYDELWNKMQEVTVAKRVLLSTQNTDLSNDVLDQSITGQTQSNEETDAVVSARQSKIMKNF